MANRLAHSPQRPRTSSARSVRTQKRSSTSRSEVQATSPDVLKKWALGSKAVYQHITSVETNVTVPQILRESSADTLGGAIESERGPLEDSAAALVVKPQTSLLLGLMHSQEVRSGVSKVVSDGLFGGGIGGGIGGLVGGMFGLMIGGVSSGVAGGVAGGAACLVLGGMLGGLLSSGVGGGVWGLGMVISCALGASQGSWEISILGSLASIVSGLLIAGGVPALKVLPEILAKKQEEQAQYEDLQAKKNEAQAHLDELDQFIERLLEKDQLQVLLSEDLSLYRAYYDECVRGELMRLKGNVESEIAQVNLGINDREQRLKARESDENPNKELIAHLKLSIARFKIEIERLKGEKDDCQKLLEAIDTQLAEIDRFIREESEMQSQASDWAKLGEDAQAQDTLARSKAQRELLLESLVDFSRSLMTSVQANALAEREVGRLTAEFEAQNG